MNRHKLLQEAIVLSCFDIANYFIKLANETGSFISNSKLQKLVYYSQAWHLALYAEPLFSEDFEAWVHGPVIPALYQKYKSFGWQPILDDPNPELDPELAEKTQTFLNEIVEQYFSCDAYELEQMTHAEAPWNRARGGLRPDQLSSAVIEKEWMKEYYESRAQEQD
ncbi:MAG: DUF4065 domain-containing protein [Cyanobacteria bacterium CAN_BIN43]|nr:DUF4065 domain-containing protein [Cyanobacteria bacterium CAN_BIN43]